MGLSPLIPEEIVNSMLILGLVYSPPTVAVCPLQVAVPPSTLLESVRTKIVVSPADDGPTHVPAMLAGAEPGPVEHATDSIASAMMANRIKRGTRAMEPLSLVPRRMRL